MIDFVHHAKFKREHIVDQVEPSLDFYVRDKIQTKRNIENEKGREISLFL